MPIPTIEELAKDAVAAVSDLLDDAEWDDFEAKTPLEKVQWRYCHADCDYFAEALSALTGWAIVAVSSPRHGPLHRLVQDPDGRMVDVMGFVTDDDLRARYGGKKLSFAPGDAFSMNRDPDDLVEELQVFLQLDVAPFNTPEFRGKVHEFVHSEGLDADQFSETLAVPKGMAP